MHPTEVTRLHQLTWKHVDVLPVHLMLAISLLLHQGRLIGAVLYGDTRHGPWYFEQALAATDLTACRHLLLFGATDAQTALDNHFDNPLDTLSSPLSLTREAA